MTRCKTSPDRPGSQKFFVATLIDATMVSKFSTSAGCRLGRLWGNDVRLNAIENCEDGPSFFFITKIHQVASLEQDVLEVLDATWPAVQCLLRCVPFMSGKSPQGIFLYQTDPSFERSVRFWRLTGPIA